LKLLTSDLVLAKYTDLVEVVGAARG